MEKDMGVMPFEPAPKPGSIFYYYASGAPQCSTITTVTESMTGHSIKITDEDGTFGWEWYSPRQTQIQRQYDTRRNN